MWQESSMETEGIYLQDSDATHFTAWSWNMATDKLFAKKFSACQKMMLQHCLRMSLEKHKTNESIRQETNVNALDLMRRLK